MYRAYLDSLEFNFHVNVLVALLKYGKAALALRSSYVTEKRNESEHITVAFFRSMPAL